MSLNPAEMTLDVAISVAVPVVAAVASLTVERVRAASKKSARGREYWRERVDERIEQAGKIPDDRLKGRVGDALNHLDAQEALDKLRLGSPVVSWSLAGMAYVMGLVGIWGFAGLWRLPANGLPMWVAGTVLVCAGFGCGIWAQVDGHLLVSRRDALREDLVALASRGPEARELLTRHPHEVHQAWKSTKEKRKQLTTNEQAGALLEAETRSRLGTGPKTLAEAGGDK